jgi:hypothetical protein
MEVLPAEHLGINEGLMGLAAMGLNGTFLGWEIGIFNHQTWGTILHQMWEMMIRDETPSISYKLFILSVSLGRNLLFRPNWYPLVWIFSGREYGSLEIFTKFALSSFYSLKYF